MSRLGEIVIFPGVRIVRSSDQSATLRLRLAGDDLKRLDEFATTLGISRDDAAGRVLRNALRLRAPHKDGGAA